MAATSSRLLPATAAAALLLCGVAHGHGDQDKPLFVAEGGADSGDCLNRGAPCGSIGYALSRAGKGGRIQVAEGTFPVENAEDVFHLISGVVDVAGGFRLSDDSSMGERGTTVLTGVPFQHRDLLSSRGFRIVADRKGVDHKQQAKTAELLDLHQKLKSSLPATACSGGLAAGLPCLDVDLLSHLGFDDISVAPGRSSDVWGFLDLNTHRQYAIVGFDVGTAVFDVTDPTTPREVGFIDGQNAVWRDIKVYQFFDDVAERWAAYAYITTDGSTDGLFVLDLTGLPHAIRRINYPSDIVQAHNVYATNTDYATGLSLDGEMPLLIVAGSDIDNGRYRTYSLADPESPTFVASGNGAGYMHDASSISISDSRKDTQCVNAGETCDILLDFNESTVDIWDVSEPATPALLSSTPYGDFGYTHSGWWSEDKQFLFVHDELDERDRGLPTTLRVFSVSDLTAPTLAGTWTGPTNATDHNGFVRGNRYYMSNYSRGLTVLDISDPANPTTVGRLDTYPVSDGSMFVGAWGAYPFFRGGSIAISDIDSGFYMAKDQTRNVPQGSLAFAATTVAAVEGQSAQLTVERTGGASGAASVDYELVNMTVDEADFSVTAATLNWADGETAERTIGITAVNDGLSEPVEALFVRLVNPTGGATLADSNTATVFISDPGAVAEIGFMNAAIEIGERGFAALIPVVHRTGSAAGAVSVDFTMGSASATEGDDFTGDVSGTVRWEEGDAEPKYLEYTVIDDGVVEGDEFFEISLSNPVGATIAAIPTVTATIKDGNGANQAPNAVAGSNQVLAAGVQVALDGGQSNDANDDALTYRWRQTMGPTVSLTNSETAVATFAAPVVNSDTLLQFELTVTDPGGFTDTATTNVTVTAGNTAMAPGGGGGGGVAGPLILLLIGLFLSQRQLNSIRPRAVRF